MKTYRAIIPPGVKARLLARVTELADAHGYLRQKRPANSRFIEGLVASSEVGGVLTEYLDPRRIKSYVKDVFIKEYAEGKRSAPPDPLVVIPHRVKGAVYADRRKEVWKFSVAGGWLLTSRCSHKRWEIGVRKMAIEASHFAAGAPRPRMTLLLQTDGAHVNSGERKQAEQALAALGVECFWC